MGWGMRDGTWDGMGQGRDETGQDGMGWDVGWDGKRFVIFQKTIIPCANVTSGLTESRQTH